MTRNHKKAPSHLRPGAFRCLGASGEASACPNVVACGGSWLCPKELLAAGNWQKIADLAKACAHLVRVIRGQ